MRLITIEFTQDTFREELDDSGETVQVKVRSEGDRLHVDPRSAKSFCDIKQVARRVGTTTDDDKSNDQVPAQTVTGEAGPVADTSSDSSSAEASGDAAGDQPGEQAATSRRGRGSSASSSSSS